MPIRIRIFVYCAAIDRAVVAGIFSQWGWYSGAWIHGGPFDNALWLGPLVTIVLGAAMIGIIEARRPRSPDDAYFETTLQRVSKAAPALIVFGSLTSTAGGMMAHVGGQVSAGLVLSTMGIWLIASEVAIAIGSARARPVARHQPPSEALPR